MFRASQLFLSVFLFVFCLGAHAQDLQILFPQEGQQVRGMMTVRYSGIPEGGYAVIKLDGNFYTATSQSTFVLNTFPPMFPGDGTHRLTIAAINEGGKKLSEKSVSFEIANSRVEAGGESVLLVHFSNENRVNPNVDRYRIFAESSATINKPKPPQKEGAAGGTGEKEEIRWMETPLDWEVGALLRRIVRDVGMYSDDKSEGFTSANIATSVQEASQHNRDEENLVRASPAKRAPWKGWQNAPETGQLLVQMIEANGEDPFVEGPNGEKVANPTRKALPPALVDFLPTFPESPVSPGSTWETNMTFLSELSKRASLRVKAPITFTTFETITTPAGSKRRAAKLESRFRLTPELAKRLASILYSQPGVAPPKEEADGEAGPSAASGPASAPPTPPAPGGETGDADAAAGEELEGPVFGPISTVYPRVLWFDFERHRVLRSEDKAHIEFKVTVDSVDEDKKATKIDIGVSYDLAVTTWFDDSDPKPAGSYTGEGGSRGKISGTRDKYKAGNPTIDKAKASKPAPGAPGNP